MKDKIQNYLTGLDNNNINYRQLTKTKLELYTKSPIYDKVLFYPKSGKLKCTTWEAEFVKVIETEIELLETIRRLERGFEL